MARTTPKLGLKVWDLRTDKWVHAELAANWDTIDAKIWTAMQQIEILSAVPTSGNFAGRLVMLNASSQGFPAWIVIRFNGSTWASVGTVEVQSFLPDANNFSGRLILLSAPYADNDPWTLHVYDGSGWRGVGRTNVQREEVATGERPRLNFLDGTGIDVQVTEDTLTGITTVAYTCTGQSLITFRRDGNSIGTRRGLDLQDSASVEIDVGDVPASSRTDLTFNANVSNSTTDRVPKLLDYVEYDPVSLTEKTLNFVPKEQQTGSPAQSINERFFYSYGWMVDGFRDSQELSYGTRGEPLPPSAGQLSVISTDRGWDLAYRDDRATSPTELMFNSRYAARTPAQATDFNPMTKSTLWEDVDASLETTFTVPDTGAVSVYLSAIVNVSASSPRRVVGTTKGSSETRYSVFVPGQDGAAGTVVSGLTQDQAINVAQQVVNENGSIGGATSGAQAVQDPNTAGHVTPGETVNVAGGTAIHSGPYVQSYQVATVPSIPKFAPLYADMSDCQVHWCLKDGDFVIPGSEICADSVGAGQVQTFGGSYGWGFRTTVQVVITGLSPGASETWKWNWRVYNPYERSTSKGIMQAGGTAGPAIIEVWSLV